MAARTLICFPIGETPGLRTEAAQLALGLAARGNDVVALGPLGPWRHALRSARITANEYAFVGQERKLTQALQEYEPQVIHAFGAETAHLVLPLTLLVGAGGVATLGHDDLARLNPTHLRTASTIFVPCEYLAEQITRRLPAVPVVTTGHLLPPADASPTTGNRFLAEKLGLRDGAPVVLLADRFQGSETDVALALIEATPAIAARIPDLQVVIAGAGVRLGELEQLAIEVNDHLGRRAVLLPGHRDDMAQLLTLTTIAVGSGRFAMEAVGAGVALVAAGPAGLVGTFTEETAQVARFTCCGRHGHLEPVSAKGLSTEIIGLFAYPQYRERFAIDGQAAVLAQAERATRAAQIASYTGRSAPAGTTLRTPQRITAILPDTLRELLFALPAIAGLQAQYPLARIQLVAMSAHQRLLEYLRLADRVIAWPTDWQAWPRFIRAIGRPRPDVCLAFTNHLAASLVVGCSCAPHRLGFAEGPGTLCFSDHLHSRAPASPARSLTLAHALGVSAGAPISPLPIAAPIQEMVNLSLLAAGVGYTDPVILLDPQASEGCAWPLDQWATLARRLAEERPERVAVLDPPDTMVLPPDVVAVKPVQDSLVLAALLARASLVIAADSDGLHLADLMGVPTIGLYGPTSPDVCGLPSAQAHPLCHREYPCHPCAGNSLCPERHCLRAITPAEVLATTTRALPLLPVLV